MGDTPQAALFKVDLAACGLCPRKRIIRIKKHCVLRDDELNAVMFLFPSLNFVGAFCRCLKAIVRWGSFVRELRFIVFIRGICEFWLTVKNGYRKISGSVELCPREACVLGKFCFEKVSAAGEFYFEETSVSAEF